MRRRLVARDEREVGALPEGKAAEQFCLEVRPRRQARDDEQIRDLLQARPAEWAGLSGRVWISVQGRVRVASMGKRLGILLFRARPIGLWTLECRLAGRDRCGWRGGCG